MISVTAKLEAYLQILVETEMYGSTVHEVAKTLICRDIERLIGAGIIKKRTTSTATRLPERRLACVQSLLPLRGGMLPTGSEQETPSVKEFESSEITRAIRARGMTLAGWSRPHGFALPSVAKVVNGSFGNPGPIAKAILRDLEREGFLKKNDPPEDPRARKSS